MDLCLKEGVGELAASSAELKEAVAAPGGRLEDGVSLPHPGELYQHTGEVGWAAGELPR